MRFTHLFDLCKKAVLSWMDDFAPSMGAAISYYTLFSLAPLLVIVIAVAGAVFGHDAVQGEIGFTKAVFGFFLPVLAGNIFGGTVIFALTAWGQVKDEIHVQ